MRSGYHHITLSKESQSKPAFVTPMGKFEFTQVPFGLAQAPAYFQRLVSEVLIGLYFAFGFLCDTLIFWPDIKTNLKHLETYAYRLKEDNQKSKTESAIS